MTQQEPSMDYLYQKPVATTSQPVVDRTLQEEETPFGVQTFPEIDSLDRNGLFAFTDQLQNKVRVTGQPLTLEETNMLSAAQRRLQDTTQFTGVQDAFSDEERKLKQRNVDEERRIRQDAARLIRDEESLAGKEFMRRSELAREQGEELKDASQQALSFSGFGRSTFAADQAAKIQKDVNRSISFFEAEANARINLARATQQ